MITSVAIIGSGQVGTSIALALAKNAPHIRVTMSDVDATAPDLVRTRFHDLEISSDTITFADSAKEAAAGSELVILATPLSAMGNVVKDIKGSLGIGTILTDTGSAKEKAIATITEALAGSGVPYVPAHPGNGSQGSGPLTGSPGNILGANSWMFVIEDPGHVAAHTPAHGLVKDFWESAGVQVTTTDTQTHDKFFGTCSHFEHLLVFSYLNMSHENPGMKEGFEKGGTAFRNLTRVAISKTENGKPSALVQMWRPIFEQNRDKIIAAGTNFQDHLDDIVKLISEGDKAALVAQLRESHDFRKTIADPEPRESIKGELFDAADNPNLIAGNILLPIIIAHSQALNARDVDADLVKGKANPSFRDGTALVLNDPEQLADLLLKHRVSAIFSAQGLKFEIQDSLQALADSKWEFVEADILGAQEIRTPLAGPRKGADTRPEFLIPKIS